MLADRMANFLFPSRRTVHSHAARTRGTGTSSESASDMGRAPGYPYLGSEFAGLVGSLITRRRPGRYAAQEALRIKFETPR